MKTKNGEISKYELDDHVLNRTPHRPFSFLRPALEGRGYAWRWICSSSQQTLIELLLVCAGALAPLQGSVVPKRPVGPAGFSLSISGVLVEATVPVARGPNGTQGSHVLRARGILMSSGWLLP